MSAADRMAVRMPDGDIRSVPRRVGLAMIARNRAKHAPQQSEPRTGAMGARPSRYAVPQPAVPHEPDATAQTSGVVDLADHEGAGSPVEFEEDDPTALPVDAPAIERPKGNAGRAAWADYARAHGFIVTDDMGRNDIRDGVVAKLESDRMSRPAFEGGRPATPEDEPVTESTVTHANPGTGTA